MFPFFSKKNDESTTKNQPDNTKSQLENLQQTMTVLDKDEMVRVEGGKSGSKAFSSVFNWNSSCGETIPQ